MQPVTLSLQGSIATLTLNQPDKLNAMDVAMGEAFKQALAQIRQEQNIRVVILTGAGRAFSSGGNLGMIEAKMAKPFVVNARELKEFYQLFLSVRDLPIPVIAAINGSAIGAGFCLALACDLRYASSQAKMGANFAKIGLAPGMGGTYLITRLAGITNATEILMLAETFSAQRALDFGLLNGLVEPERLLPHVHAIAHQLLQNGPVALGMIKKGLQLAPTQTLHQLFDYDANCQAECFATDDIREGVSAIRDKRLPAFTGR